LTEECEEVGLIVEIFLCLLHHGLDTHLLHKGFVIGGDGDQVDRDTLEEGEDRASLGLLHALEQAIVLVTVVLRVYILPRHPAFEQEARLASRYILVQLQKVSRHFLHLALSFQCQRGWQIGQALEGPNVAN